MECVMTSMSFTELPCFLCREETELRKPRSYTEESIHTLERGELRQDKGKRNKNTFITSEAT